MKATLVVRHDSAEDSINRDRLLELMVESGVLAGLKEEALEDMIVNQRFDEEVVIAEGQPPQHGEDGRIEYLFDPYPTLAPNILPDGSVDYASLNILQKAVPGQILAKLLPPTQGTAGFDLSGSILPAIPGKPKVLGKGQNTSFTDASESVIKSDVHGHVRLGRDHLVEAATVYEVKGDVNYTIGNIDFEGDVIVRGDVLSGFIIHATGDIEVKGVVEDAEISAGRNVIVRGGFIGSGKGHITAEGDILLRYIHHQQATAGSDLIISNEATDAHLTARKGIKLLGSPGVLVGGVASADNFIECRFLGNDQGTTTDAVVAFDDELALALAKIEEQIDLAENQIRKINDTLDRMEEMDAFIHRISEERRAIYSRLVDAKLTRQDDLDRFHSEKRILEEKHRARLSELFILAHKGVYLGVNINIAGIHYQIQEHLGRSHFKIMHGEVILTDQKGESRQNN